jgi:hypothetical protein
VEVGEDVPQEAGKLLRGMVRGSSATEMKLGDAATIRKAVGYEVDLAAQKVEVRDRAIPLRRGDDVTAAKKAPLLTKWHVNVNRERLVGGAIGSREKLFVDLRSDAVVELHGRWIARVSRPGEVITGQQLGGDLAGNRSLIGAWSRLR